MDEKFWFYIVLGAIYFLSRLLKKDPNQPPSTPPKPRQQQPAQTPRRQTSPGRLPTPTKRTEPARTDTAPKAMTFEELMRQIMESKTTTPRQEPVVDYNDDLETEERNLEDVDYNSRRDSEALATYEKAKQEAFHRPSLEETMRVQDTVVTFGKFGAFQEKTQPNLAEQYLREFTDMDSVRKAVVMSEILKPKF